MAVNDKCASSRFLATRRRCSELLWLGLVLLLLVGGCADDTPSRTGTSHPLLELQMPVVHPESVGYLLFDLETGARLEEKRADQPFIPASTAKLLSAAAALEVLGHEYRFQTEVRVTGALVDGVLTGDLILVGGGDPLLDANALMVLAAKLRKAGISRVSGRFLFDVSALPEVPNIDAAQPKAAGYNTSVGALSVDFNQQKIVWRQVGTDEAQAFAAPIYDVGEVSLTVGSPYGESVLARPDGWAVVTDALPDGDAAVAVRRPGYHTARVFHRVSAMMGLILPAPEAGRSLAGARLVAVYESAPLSEVLRAGLEFSNNLVSELIGLAVAQRISGRRPGSLTASAETISAWWRETRPAGPWKGMRLPNHSGLSAQARLTPAQLVEVLRRAWNDGDTDGAPFVALLPAAGTREAFEGRLDGPNTALRVWGKTGTMMYTSGLAGYLYTASKRRLAFAILVTSFGERKAYDEQNTGAVSRAEAWLELAKALERDLVTRWARRY